MNICISPQSEKIPSCIAVTAFTPPTGRSPGWIHPKPSHEEERDLEQIPTPHTATIADLAQLLQIPVERTAKAVFFSAQCADREERVLIFAIVRGDMDVNETKLTNLVKAIDLRPATDEEIKAFRRGSRLCVTGWIEEEECHWSGG